MTRCIGLPLCFLPYCPNMQSEYSNQAVVVGGTMAGMLAARVLAPYFERVVIIERDVLSRLRRSA